MVESNRIVRPRTPNISLLDVSTEILNQILSYDSVGSLARKDFLSVILTCKRLYQIALPSLHRKLQAWFPLRRPTLTPQMESMIRTFTHHPDRLAWVQMLTASWDRSSQDPPIEFFKMLSKFTSMRQLTLSPYGAAWYDAPLMSFLDHCHEFTSLQHVEIFNPLLTTIDIIRIYTIPNLSTLVIDDFRIPKDADFTQPRHEYKPTKLASIEFHRTDCLPIGLCVKFLLKNHPLLKTLRWSIQNTGYRCNRFDSKAVSESLSAVRPCLTKLHISFNNSYYIVNDCQLDFSDFIALQSLEIHERITLARNVPATTPQYSRQDLPGRLPDSLQILKISFDPKSQVLREQLSGPVDYSWIVALARRKELMNTQLSTIDLKERPGWAVERIPTCQASPAKIPDLVEWVYPEDIIETFRKSSIKLRVMLRAPQD